MRKMIFFLWVLFLSPSIAWAQEKVNAPVWNVGDKWIFTQGNIEVIGADKKSYALNYSKDTCLAENLGFETIIFGKSTLNRIYYIKGDKREKYAGGIRKILNFPFNPGKQWQDSFYGKPLTGFLAGRVNQDYSESFNILGWEDVQVSAGNFKALRLEYKVKNTNPGSMGYGSEGGIRYWYFPGAKYFIKCQYDKDYFAGEKDWELTSISLKK